MITALKSIDFNPEQARAIFTARDKALVLAGAGTGKTTVLTGRVCHLIETGASPRQIQAFTFTNKAAQELRDRLHQLIPKRSHRAIGAGTFHSFCYRIIDEWASKLGYRRGVSVVDEQDREDIIHGVLDDLFPKKKRYLIRCIEKGSSATELALVMDEYRHRLRTYNCIDFDLLQEYTIELLEKNPEVLAHVRSRAKHVLVDEFQDTDPTQARLLELLDPQSLFVVGDDWQAIYGFRGADFKILLGFQKRHPNADQVILPKNYRSTREIIEAANRLIKFNTMRTEKNLVAANGKAGPVPEVKALQTRHEEAQWIARRIRELHDDAGTSFKDIALLARTNQHIQTIIDAGLRPARIPVQAITDERSIWQSVPARGFLRFFRALENPWDYQAKAQVLNFPLARVDRKAMTLIRRHMARYDLDLYKAVRDKADILPQKDATLALLQTFSRIRDYNRTEQPDVFELALRIDKECGISEQYHRMDMRSKLHDTESFLHRLRIWVQERKHEEDVDTKALITYAVSLSLQDAIRDDGEAVKAMTVHAAKGLEFPVVIVAGCTEGLFPHQLSLKEGNIEEERRLFYVACTRAKDRLILTRFEERSSDQFRPWERPGPVEGSRFIAEATGEAQIH